MGRRKSRTSYSRKRKHNSRRRSRSRRKRTSRRKSRQSGGVNNENYIIKSRCEDRFSKNFKVLKFNKKIQLENFKTNCIDIGKIRLLLIELSNSNKTVDNTTNEIKNIIRKYIKKNKKRRII